MATEPGNTHGATTDGSGGRLPSEVIETIHADERRCLLLSILHETDDGMPLTDLAREVAAREQDCPADQVSDADVRAVRDDVYEHHLPKLTAPKILTFDSLVGTVALATDDERVVPDD